MNINKKQEHKNKKILVVVLYLLLFMLSLWSFLCFMFIIKC